MKCVCKTEERRIVPAVHNLKQFLNSTETMVWRLDSHTANGGECDLCEYDAFLVLSKGGEIDEVALTKAMVDADGDGEAETMELTWNVGTYATALAGYVKYQIIFRNGVLGRLGVIGSDDAKANGSYTIDVETQEGTARTYTNADSGYTIRWDSTNKRWTIYQQDGSTVAHYQKFANPEPYCGNWDGVLVGNNTAAVWTSDEAIMYISETIAADEAITANFPTILRQMWDGLRKIVLSASGVLSVNGKTGVVDLVPSDIGAAEEVHRHQASDIDGLAEALETEGDTVIEERHIRVHDSDILWYRRWKSGWLEQGGRVSTNSLTNPTTVTFPVPFVRPTNGYCGYIVSLAQLAGVSGTYKEHTITLASKSSTGITVNVHASSDCMTGFEWVVRGRETFYAYGAAGRGTFDVDLATGDFVKVE